MRKFGAVRGSSGLRGIAGGVVLATALFGGVGGAAAAPPANPAPAAPAPAPAPAAGSLTLSTMPAKAAGRNDLAPTLEVQADGRAVKSPDAADPNRRAGQQPKKIDGRVPPEALTAAIADAKTLVKADMGVAKDADGSSTLLDILGKTPDQDVHLVIYSPMASDGLTDEQKANRKHFTDLCQKLLNAFVADH